MARPLGIWPIGYDLNGNITSENTRTLVYDLSDQLIQILNGGTQTATYTYNGGGQRIKKATQADIRIFHYDPWGHLIAETNQSGQVLAEYIYLGDKLLAKIQGEQAYYFHNDHLGTPQLLTNDSQTIAWKTVYTPFGEAVPSIQTVDNPFRFPGQYYDPETGLHYNYHRYYDPMTGRYVTPDPIGLWGEVNLFVYVKNNPVRFKDPRGLFRCDEFGCIPNPDQDPDNYHPIDEGEAFAKELNNMEIPPWVCEMGAHAGCHVLCEGMGASPAVCIPACIAAAALACPEKCH